MCVCEQVNESCSINLRNYIGPRKGFSFSKQASAYLKHQKVC